MQSREQCRTSPGEKGTPVIERAKCAAALTSSRLKEEPERATGEVTLELSKGVLATSETSQGKHYVRQSSWKCLPLDMSHA